MSDSSRVQDSDLARYWAAVDACDDHAALAGAVATRDRGVPLVEVLTGLVIASQLRVGELWADNEWTVAREHAATAVSESVVRRLAETLPEPAVGPQYLVGCVEREWHALPALVVATTLRATGHRVDYLGTTANPEQLRMRVEAARPRAVLLSASLTSSLHRVRRDIEVVRATGTPVIVGGRAFDPEGRRARTLGATAYAPSTTIAVEQFATLPVSVEPAPALVHPGAAEADRVVAELDDVVRDVMTAADHELGLSGGGEQAVPPDDWRVVLATFVPYAVESLVGALVADDPWVVADNRAWLRGVLASRGAPAGTVEALDHALARRLADLPQAQRMLMA